MHAYEFMNSSQLDPHGREIFTIKTHTLQVK